MRILGVIDLLGGRAVHAVAGRRDRYEPVRRVAGTPIEPGDAEALGRWYVHEVGLTGLYVADLDAILGGAPNRDTVARLAGLAADLWLDAGISTVAQAVAARHQGATGIVVGLETLPSFEALRQICAAAGGARVAFSLDLRNGAPVTMNGVDAGQPPAALAALAVDAGASAVIMVDLARVGTGAGVDMALVARVRAAIPAIPLFVGGGVQGRDDLNRLAAAGCDGALVATALQAGRLGAAEKVEKWKVEGREVSSK